MPKTAKTKAIAEPLTPADIRRIREALGLNQVEAGELLGGGIRAFQKYESGTVSPSATTISLLRILEAEPTALGALTGTATPVQQTGLRPFEVTGAHITALRERHMVALTRRLLSAEAAKYHLLAMIHVASNITATDGGEDARITWTDGPDRTSHLPSRDCLLQVKAAPVTASRAAKDVLTSKGDLEPTIRELLESGGNYIMICNRPYTRKAVGERELAVRNAITAQGVTIKPSQVVFRDADQIAAWANEHPQVATWVLEQTQPGMAGTLRTWVHWAGRHEHEYPFVQDDRLEEVRQKVRTAVAGEREVVRIVGLSGLGKSRLVLEALADDDNSPVQTSDSVLYGVETEVGNFAVMSAVQFLADLGRRAVIVVDRCSVETHVDLAAIVRRSSSKLSLITIDHEVPGGTLPSDTLIVDRAADGVVEAVIRGMSPGLPAEDLRRVVSFSNGFPQMAVLAAEAWSVDAPLTGVTKDYMIDQVVIGRRPIDRQQVLQTAKLLSTFGMVGYRDELAGEVDTIAPLSSGLDASQLRANLNDLLRRRVVQPRGRYATVQPRPIAHSLAERQWQEWTKDQWEEVLARLPATLRTRAAKQLALLNRTEIALEVTRHLCRIGGPYDTYEAIQDEGNAGVIESLSQVDAIATGELLTRVLAPLSSDDLKMFDGRARGEIRWAVQRIAFIPDAFELGANLLLKLALGENESFSNNCTGQFKALFPAYLGDTAADGSARLAFLDELIAKDDPELNPLIVGALESGARVSMFSRSVGIESHGLRPALQPWNPTNPDAVEYITDCLERLLVFALRDDEVGCFAKQSIANDLRNLINRGLIEYAERAVTAITAQHGAFWPAALSSLGDVITYDMAGSPREFEPRIRAMIAMVTPSDLGNRLKLLVTEMPWDYPCDEKLDFDKQEMKQREAIYALATEALKSPEVLLQALPDLCVGGQRMSALFGAALAELTDDKLGWLWKLFDVHSALPSGTWNVDLITSYLATLDMTHPRLVSTFKRRAIRSPRLAWLVPTISFKNELPAADIPLVCDGLRNGVLPVQWLQTWSLGGRLAKREPSEVAPLFDQLFSVSEQAGLGYDLLGMYVHGRVDFLEYFRPQIRMAAETALTSGTNTLIDHHFHELMSWMLNHGRDDADARAVALSFARRLAEDADSSPLSDERRIRPLLPVLLREFPEIVWPLIGSAITSNPKTAWRFQHSLGKGLSFTSEEGHAPILELSRDTLLSWCHAHPDVAPAFLATILPPLSGGEFHPILRRIIDEFGDRAEVQSSLSANMHTFGWSGSMTTYYEMYQKPLATLRTHHKSEVRQWARRMSAQIERQIAHERDFDDEHEARYD